MDWSVRRERFATTTVKCSFLWTVRAPRYLGQVRDDLSAFHSGVVVLIDKKGLNHHQNLQIQSTSVWVAIQYQCVFTPGSIIIIQSKIYCHCSVHTTIANTSQMCACTNLAVFTELEELLLTVSSSGLWCEAHSGSDLCATLTILCRALLLDVLQLECRVEMQRVSKIAWGSVTARVNTKWIQSTLKQSKVFSSCAGWDWLQPVQRQRSALSLHFWGEFTLTREPSPHWWCEYKINFKNPFPFVSLYPL